MGAVADISKISKFSGHYGDDVSGLDAASLVGLDALASSLAQQWSGGLHCIYQVEGRHKFAILEMLAGPTSKGDKELA